MTMTEQLTTGPHHRETEFWRDPATGLWLTGTCGPCALAMAAWNATGKETHTLDVYHLMRSHGLCDTSGASTPAQLHAATPFLGLHVLGFVGYGGDNWPGWRAFLDTYAGKAVIVLELANGQALHDEVSGKGENAVNLRYHYICGYGPQGDGWAFADGDNFAEGDVLQRYSYATLAAAKPCAAIAIQVEAPTMSWVKQANGTGRDAHGHTCGAGDMSYMEAHGLAGSDGLMSETAYNGPDTFLPLASQHIITAQRVAGTWTIGENGADVLLNVWQQLQAAKAGDNPPPPPPAPTPLTPYQLAAIAATDAQIAADSAIASAAALKGK